jgi:hypothetical protein
VREQGASRSLGRPGVRAGRLRSSGGTAVSPYERRRLTDAIVAGFAGSRETSLSPTTAARPLVKCNAECFGGPLNRGASCHFSRQDIFFFEALRHDISDVFIGL